VKKSLFILFIFVQQLLAHQTGLSYYDIKEDSAYKIFISYKKPLSDSKAQNLHFRFPPHCQQSSSVVQNVVNGFIIQKHEMQCTKKGLKESRIWVDGLVRKDRGVVIHYSDASGHVEKALLRATTPFIYINHQQSSFELFKEYVKLGVEHIWSGFDHLLFVFALLLLALNFKAVLYAVTAFTLSHSITLACGILGIVDIPVKFIEAMIALSIVFLARELLVDNKESYTRKHLELVTFTFGLLHGFGFSNALASIGLPREEIPLSLFAFNVGIEIGQLIFITVVSGILYLLYPFMKKSIKKRDMVIAYFIGTISSYWLIERVLSF